MEHSDFVTKYRAGKIAASIDKNEAGFMYKNPNLMPRNLRNQQVIIRTVVFGGVLVGLMLYFFTPWWLATIVLVLSMFMAQAAQYHAASGVLKAALKDPHIFQVALENHVLFVEERA